jgi:hypothetical protein
MYVRSPVVCIRQIQIVSLIVEECEAVNVARMGEKRNSCRVFAGSPEAKRPLGRFRRSWENNKLDLRER